jgi:tetratricopeptide (TPR) repeat protein
MILATVLLAVVAGGIYLYREQRSRRSDQGFTGLTVPDVPGKRPLVVLDFENRSGSKDLDWMRAGLAEMLITNLSRSNSLAVLSRQQAQMLLTKLERPAGSDIRLNEALEIGRRSKVEVIVLGSFAMLDGRVRVEAQLHDARNGQLLAAEHFIAERLNQILTQVDLLSLKLASHLRAPGEQQMETGLADVMTDSLEAYRYYSLALEKAQALENREAIQLLERAVALDSEFAMAHARIGYVYALTWGFADKAKPHLEKAFQLSNRLTEKDKLYINAWYATANLDYAGAIKVFREIVARYPMEDEAYSRLGRLLQGEERLDEAVDVARQGLAVDPQAQNLYNLLGSVYSELGRHDQAIAAHQHYVALASNVPNAHDSLGTTYQWAGRYAEAIEEFKRALILAPEFEVAVVHLANVYFQQGRYRDALEQYRRYIKVAPSNLERSRGYACMAHVYSRMGNIERAEQAAKVALRYDKTFAWHRLKVALDRKDLATAKVLEDQVFSDWPYTNRGARLPPRFSFYIRGYLNLRLGKSAEAIENFKDALRHRPATWNIDTYEDCLANAYLEVGRLDEAIAEYERILKLNPNYPLANYRLAEVYARKGKQDLAMASYARFLQIWEDADQDLPEIIAAKKYRG